MRILAIDYGKKRTGIAVTDPLQIIAQGLTTVDTHMALVFLKDYMQKEQVETIIIGDPRNMDDSETDATAAAAEFTKKLKRHFPGVKIVTVDERYSSKMASQAMIDMGMKKKDRQKKGMVDEVAATILLQEYLSSKQ
ncbi:MAG TPA: Holliday junction resolvase RuvX [Chitinophagaceae bacterium]|nr:Holliday junction resolvase RuvX [Chitinophagaceae bacterium]